MVKIKNKIIVWATVCLILLISGMAIDHDDGVEEKVHLSTHVEQLTSDDYIEHGPIRIDNDQDFVEQDWAGSGYIDDPWMIEGYDIDAGGYGYGIYIGNVSDHFVVRDCYIYNASGMEKPYFSNTGLYLNNVENGMITDNILERHEKKGIWLKDSKNTEISNNILQNNSVYSIRIENSFNNDIEENQLLDNYRGIYLYDSSSDNNVVDNYAEKNDFGISLIHSYDNIIKYNTGFNNTVGIQLYESNSNLVEENTAEKNDYGISFAGSIEENNVTSNELLHNEYGVYISDSKNQLIEDNIFEGNGVFITGEKLAHWDTHTISTDNSVEGKPIYYYHSERGGTVPSDAGQVILADCKDMVVEDLEVSSSSAGILMGFSSNNDIERNELTNGLYGIYLYNSQNNDILDNDINSNSRHGIRLESSNQNSVIDNTVSQNLEDGIHVKGSNENTVSNNIITENEYHGIHLSKSNKNHLAENSITNNFGYGVSFSNSTGNAVEKNSLSNNDWGGVIFSDSKEHSLEENEMTENGIIIWGDLLEYWDSHSISTTNTVNGRPVYYWTDNHNQSVPSDAGQIILVGCENIKVKDQDLSQGSVGVQLGFSSKNTITSNNVSGNDWCGISLKNSDNNIIKENTASRNGEHGIHLSSSKNNALGKNTANSNINAGISLRSSRSNLINNNTLYNNNPGISLDLRSNDNTIYHNNFIKNLVQARDHGDNQWDNGYPIGGNYWSDYDKEYPDAGKVADGDIWVTPYRGEGFVDDYPLTEATDADEDSPTQNNITTFVILIAIILTVIMIVTWMKTKRGEKSVDEEK